MAESIVADSAPGQGTTFTVTLKPGSAHLPAERVFSESPASGATFARTAFVQEARHWVPLEDDAALPAPHPDDGGVRVLVADDNADMRRYVSRLLSAFFQVEAVTNGREALAALQRTTADLVITDVMMPELDGFGLLRSMKASDAFREVPVILVSARSGEESRIQGLEAGADDYLTKPFSARELVARVRSQIALTQARRQVAAERDRLRGLLSQLEEQAVALTHARQDAENASRAKDEFLAMLGHELRNPLAPIVTALELMRLRGSATLRAGHHRATGRPSGAAGGRPARRVAHHPRQDRAQYEAARDPGGRRAGNGNRRAARGPASSRCARRCGAAGAWRQR